MLLVQSPCAWHFKRPKLKTSEFRVREGLLMEKVPTEKMWTLVIPQIHLPNVQHSGFVYLKGRGNGSGKSWLKITDIWVSPGVLGRLWNFFVPSQLTPVELTLFMRLLQMFDKQLLFWYIFLPYPRERYLHTRGYFCKNLNCKPNSSKD